MMLIDHHNNLHVKVGDLEYRSRRKEVMYRVCGLRLDPNFVVQLAAGKNFYLRLAVERMGAFEVITKKYLQTYSWSSNNITAAANYTNPKT